MIILCLRRLAGFTSLISKRDFSHFCSIGPDGILDSSITIFLAGSNNWRTLPYLGGLPFRSQGKQIAAAPLAHPSSAANRQPARSRRPAEPAPRPLNSP